MLVFLNETVAYCIFGMFLNQLFFLLMLVMIKPFKSKKLENLKITSNTSFTVALAVIGYMEYYYLTIDENLYKVLGVLITLFLGLIALLELYNFFEKKLLEDFYAWREKRK